MPRYSIKPGRGPSSFGAIGGVIGAIFGVLWTIFAIVLTADAPFPIVKIIFPLFGVVFIVASIGVAIYHGHNATQPNRFSEFDVVPTETEPEPVFRSSTQTGSERVAEKYCTHCGAEMREQDKFCSACGGATTG
jgi:hypothetical protein